MSNLFNKQFLIIKKIKFIFSAKEQRNALLFLGFLIISMVLEAASIGMIIPMMQVISDPEVFNSTGYIAEFISLFNINSNSSLMTITAIALFLVFFIKNIFLSFVAWFKINFAANLRMNLSNRLFELYLSQPYTFHLQHNSGQLIQNISNEVAIFTGRLLTPLTSLVGEVFVMIGIIILLFLIEPIGTIIIAVILGLVAGMIVFYTRVHVSRWGTERQFHDGKRIQHLQQGLGGIKDVLFLGRENYFFNKYRFHTKKSTNPDIKQTFLQEIPRFWFEMLAILGLCIMIVVLTMQGKNITTLLSTLAVFAAAGFRLMPSVTRILASYQSLRYSMPVLDVLFNEFNSIDLNLSKSFLEKNKKKSITEFSNVINLKNISYTYPKTKKPSLQGVSLKILRGECIGIIGTSGSGKSTLVDVILGLLKPNIGEVIVDNKNIFFDKRTWQKQIGYVPQSIFLTDDTLRNNIAFGIPSEKIDDLLIHEAINLAQLRELVDSLPEGLETFVGERGVRLSGGQRQRIGIARALYYNPKVIVFDEATSSLDIKTETQIMKTVHSLHRNKTIIIVAHRLTTVQDCDRLYKLELGKIVAEGNSDEILSQ
jgi:ATP-binding cassette, subfamily B, bacterial PglK